MVAVGIVVVVTLVWLRGLLWLYHRGVGHRLAAAPSAPAPGRVVPAAVDALDDAAFCIWLGVLPATYERYLDTGIEDLQIYLADHPQRLG